jgi:hypothetical protein
MTHDSKLIAGLLGAVLGFGALIVAACLRDVLEASMGTKEFLHAYVSVALAVALVIPGWFMFACRDDSGRNDGGMP